MNGSVVERYIGMSSASAYTQLLLTHLRVQRVSVFRYRSPPSLQQRIQLTSPELLLIDQALALRRSTRLPFWNALFTVCLLSETHTSQLVDAAFFHGGPGEAVAYSRNAVEAGVLEKLTLQGAANVGISSEVRDASGCVWHLPLLDFHCEISPQNEALAALVCSHLMPDGYLLIDSGDSYHACGFALSTSEERVHMLGKALLTAPIVDIHYIAHQLQQDASSIRISKGGKASRGPFVVRAWAPG
jgi:hypothetical protein